ncbi:MAG: HD domain-containing protein [Eubacterium sp.]|nr:HD domain-containing protein [Eubacterium sp.]
MRYTTYAAIVIGSRNILLRVYTIQGSGIHLLDSVSHEYDLGREAYTRRYISLAQIEEICQVLEDLKGKLAEYGVDKFRCYGTSVIRRAANQLAVINHIRIRTGLKLVILGNSEIRFLMYKGIQLSGLDFDSIIQKNTAILDIGSGSVQVSLFDKKALYMTQNLDIGTARVRELLDIVERYSLNYVSVLEEYIEYEINAFKSSFLKDKLIKNVIVIGDESRNLNRIAPELNLADAVHYDQICYIFKKLKKASYQDIAFQYGLSMEEARMVLPSVIIYKLFLEQSKADTLFLCGTNLCDGSVVDYAQETKKAVTAHDFYQDIIASARYIGKRYRYNKNHAEYIRSLSLDIFDHSIKYHGLDRRDRLILEIAAILHDIGKFVNMNEPGRNGYQLILSTEIMGLSLRERREVAGIVLYSTEEIPEPGEGDVSFLGDAYLRIAKLTAILRLANALDRSHKQKFKTVSMARKGKELLITVESDQDMTLEAAIFEKKAEYFNEILGIRPVLRQKQTI